MWVDYKLYMKAESNYNLYLEGKHPPQIFFDFLCQFLGERQEGDTPFGTVNYHLNKNGEVHHIINLSKHANKVVKVLAGPYSHALLTAHYARIKDDKSIKERDQPSQESL